MKNLYLAFFAFAILFSGTIFSQLPQLAWANTLDSLMNPYEYTGSSLTNNLTYDNAGNIYSVGYFYGAIDANSGVGVDTLAALSSAPHAFIVKNNSNGDFVWAKALQGTGSSDAVSVKVDALGNVFLMGTFRDNVDFDPGIGVFSVTSATVQDMFMEKLDASGNFVWAKVVTGNIIANSLALDALGNPIFVGVLSGTADFDPNVGVVSLTGTTNSFILKLNFNGQFVFVKHLTSTSANNNSIEGIHIKSNGDILLTGYFINRTDFDPDAGVAELSSIGGTPNSFICQLNSNGNYIWAKSIIGSSFNQINASDVDASGNILLTGRFRSICDFDPGSSSYILAANGANLDDIFVAKYSPTGDFIWAKQIGNPNENYTDENANDIAVDPSGNVFITGFFYNTIDFNPDAGVFDMVAALNRNSFVCGLTSNGAFNFAFKYDMGVLAALSQSEVIEIDENGNIYVGGYTNGICDMDPSAAVSNLSSEFNQGFVVKYGPSGSEALFSLESNSSCVDRIIGLQSTNAFLQSSWLWTATGGTIDDPTSSNTSISFPSSGTYTVTLTVTSGLGTTVSTQTINVNNNPSLIVQASPNIVCLGQSTTLWATHSSPSLSWNSGQVSDYITVYPTVSTTYTATVTASNGCSTSASQNIEVATASSTIISVLNDTICAGESVTLTASGASDFVWSTGDMTPSITVNPTSFSAYSVTGITGTCQATANQVIYVLDPPSVTMQSSANSSCNGASVTLTAFGGDSYVWSTGETTSSIVVTPTFATTYTVTGTNLSGCQDLASKTITIGTTPNINISASNDTPCAGSIITLTATGGSTYLWGGGQTTNTISAIPSVNTTFTVVGTNTDGCQATFNKTINVDPLPIISIQSSSNSVCAGSSVTLTASGANSYTWNGGQTTDVISVNPTSTTTYTATGTNSFNCQASASKTITVNALPSISIQSVSNSICEGGNITLTGSGANSYSWSSGQSTASITVSPTTNTTYTLIGIDGSNCQGTATKTINVNPLPTVSIQVTEDTICQGNSTVLNGLGASTYTWSTGANTSSINVSPSVSSNYNITGTSSFGCQNVANTTIIVLPFPTVSFTNPITDFCTNSATYDFIANPLGGIFTGTGISGATFNPTLAGSGTHLISYTFSDELCSATTTIEISVNDCASIENMQNETIQVFPNPANDQLLITGLIEDCLLELFNEQGQLIWKEKTTSTQSILHLNSIASGIYQLSIQTDKNREIRKVVVQH